MTYTITVQCATCGQTGKIFTWSNLDTGQVINRVKQLKALLAEKNRCPNNKDHLGVTQLITDKSGKVVELKDIIESLGNEDTITT